MIQILLQSEDTVRPPIMPILLRNPVTVMNEKDDPKRTKNELTVTWT